MIFLGALLGFLYLQSGVSSSQDVISKLSAIFIGICFPGWTVMTSIIPVMLRNRVVFYREQSSYMYTPYAYAFAISVVEIFYTCLSCIIFLALFYPMVGLIIDPTLFFRYFFQQYLVMLVWLSLGQLCASLLPDILVANIMSQLIGTFAILFSGIFLTAGEMPKGWKWIYWMNWIPKALDPMTTDQFSCNNDSSNCQHFQDSVVLPDGSSQANLTPQDYVHQYLDSDNAYWHWIGWQFLTLAVFRLFIVMAVAKVNYMKR